jgi:L-iditol 2-dehydrogenase
MKAALKTPEGTFKVEDVNKPQLPGPDWILLRVKVAGICGTDLRHWKQHEPSLEGKIMGHEVAGEISEVGSGVTGLKPGDRVVVETLLGDETCEWCRVQKYNICPNLYAVRSETVSKDFADYIVAPAKKAYKLPDHVSYEEAALLDTFSVSLHAIQLSGIKINDKVSVTGAGCIGLAQLQLAKACGADVIITDITDSALALAKELGADEVVNSKTDDVYKRVMEFTGNRGVDIAFECAGGTAMEDTLRQTVNFARIGGKVVIVGGFDGGMATIALPWQHMQMSEIQVIPSASYAFWGLYPEMQICLDLLAKGKINAKKMITHHFPLDQINEGFETARDKENTAAVFVALQVQ